LTISSDIYQPYAIEQDKEHSIPPEKEYVHHAALSSEKSVHDTGSASSSNIKGNAIINSGIINSNSNSNNIGNSNNINNSSSNSNMSNSRRRPNSAPQTPEVKADKKKFSQTANFA
jgi:hypothetical protein